MTLKGIIYHFLNYDNKVAKELFPDDLAIRLLMKAAPWLQMSAPIDASEYWEHPIEKASDMPKQLTRKYLLQYHEFDTVEISLIVKVFKEHVEKNVV